MTDTRQAPGREPMTWHEGKMVPRREVERIRAAEAAAATAPPPQGPATVREEEHQADPAPVTPGRTGARPAPASSITVPLIEGIVMEIASAPGGGWITQFVRGGDTLTEDRSPAEPWIEKRAVGRLTRALAAVVPALKEAAIKGAITGAFDGIRDTPDGKALMSEPAARVIGATAAVEIELTDPPTTVVKLDDGRTMIFSSGDMGSLQAKAINERWYAVRRELLMASHRDFVEIAQYWISIAEEVEPLGARSAWERIAEDLSARIAPLPLEEDRRSLLKNDIWQEPGGPLWVASSLIQDVVRMAGQNEYDTGFSRYLEQEGILIGRSKLIRVGSTVKRAWGLDPSFKPKSEAGTFTPLAGGPEERP